MGCIFFKVVCFVGDSWKLELLRCGEKKNLKILSNIFKSAFNCGAKSVLEPHEPCFMHILLNFGHYVFVDLVSLQIADTSKSALVWDGISSQHSAQLHGDVVSGLEAAYPVLLPSDTAWCQCGQTLSSFAAHGCTTASPGFELCSIPCCLPVTVCLR